MKQTVNIGTAADDGTGDLLRNAFDKVNDNFTELYSLDGGNIKCKTVVSAMAGTAPTAAEVTAAVGLTPVQAGAGYICFGVFNGTPPAYQFVIIVSDGTYWYHVSPSMKRL